MTESNFLKPKEAAKILGITTRTLINWSNEGILGSFKTLKGHRRFYKDEINKILEEKKNA